MLATHPVFSRIRLIVTVAICVAVSATQSFAIQHVSALRLRLVETNGALLQYASIGFVLEADVTWAGPPPVRIPTILDGSERDAFLTVDLPTGELLAIPQVQPKLIGIPGGNGGSWRNTAKREGNIVRWEMRLGYDWVRSCAIFVEPGVYRLSVSMGGVTSNAISVTCRLRPESEEAVLRELQQLQLQGALGAIYDGRLLALVAKAESQARIESLARNQDTPDLNTLCRFAIAEHLICDAKRLSLSDKPIGAAFALGRASGILGESKPTDPSSVDGFSAAYCKVLEKRIATLRGELVEFSRPRKHPRK